MVSTSREHKVVKGGRALRRPETNDMYIEKEVAAMDMVISGGEDSLLESLSFELPATTSYIQSRRLVSYFPSGASNLSTNGVRVCRFTIAGDSWLDPSSLRVYAKLANTSSNGTVLQLADGPHSLFSRCRLFCGGTMI